MKPTRREFIKYGTLFLANMCFRPTATVGGMDNKSVVVQGIHQGLTDSWGKINEKNVHLLFLESLKTFTGTSSVKDAWGKVFPGLQEKDRIGIKVNVINRFMPTHPQLVKCVTDSLVEFGVKPSNIIIWDRLNSELRKAGYGITRGGKEVQCYGTNTDGVGFDKKYRVQIGSKRLPVSRILSREITHIINMPVLKDHSNAGLTFSLKNHYGNLPLINAFPDPRSAFNVHHVHKGNCEIQIRDLNADPIIRKKTRLVIGDAILGIYDGGPSGTPQFIPNRIFISTDPVATDYVAMGVVDRKRKEMGLSSIVKRARYIKKASESGLGSCGRNRVEILDVVLG